MKRREMLKAGSAALLGMSAFPLGWTAAAEKKKQKVLYFTRNVGFYHSVVQRRGKPLSHSERILIEMGDQAGFDVECTKDGRVFDGDLDRFDAFAFYTNGDLTLPNKQKEPPMSPEGKQRLLDAVAGGKGFVGFHATCASWRTPRPDAQGNLDIDPYIAMLGGEFVAHGPQQKATLSLTSPFPGTENIGPDGLSLLEEWYALKNFAEDLHVILVQQTRGMKGGCYQRPDFPSTWARPHGKGRVFFTSLGHREDIWTNVSVEEIMLGGFAWAMGNVEADVKSNIDKVTPQAGQMKR